MGTNVKTGRMTTIEPALVVNFAASDVLGQHVGRNVDSGQGEETDDQEAEASSFGPEHRRDYARGGLALERPLPLIEGLTALSLGI
jgi:hypothetical protein